MGLTSDVDDVEYVFLQGGSELARRIASYDWSATAIGPIEGWSPSLKHTVSLMLASPVPLVLLWGEAGVMIYNDAYSGFAGGRDSTLLGSNVREGWGEIAAFNDNVMRVGLSGRQLSYRDHELTLDRDGRPEPVWMNLDYSPVRGEDGQPAGVIAVVVETTEIVRARAALEQSEARLRFLDGLNAAVADLRDADDILAVTTQMTAEHLGVTNCAYADMDEDQDGFTIRGDWYVEGSASLVGHYQLADFGTLAVRELAAGRSLIVNDALAELPSPEAARFHESGVAATICVPLVKAGKLTALMAIHDRAPHRWSEYECSVIREVTERSWAHIQRVSAEGGLRLSEERLRRAQSAGGIGLFSIDIATDTISVTPEFCHVFGIEQSVEIPASAVEHLISREDADLSSTPDRRRSGDVLLDIEYRIRRADTGEERIIARKAEYEYDETGARVRLVGAVQDVTERQRIQSALERSEAQFSALAQNMPNQVWTARADGALDWLNDRIYTFSGVPRGSLEDERWFSIVHPDDLQPIVDRWRTSFASGTIYENEFRMRDAEGVYRWHLARAVPLRDALGEITAWVGTNTEIDAQKRAEETYAQDRDRLWTTSQDILLVCDYDGRITAINPSGERLLGWNHNEMVGRLLTDFVHPDDLHSTIAEVATIGTGVATLTFENRYRTRDGEYLLLDWTAVPDGVRIHGVGRDITEQRAIEDALRQSHKMEAVGQLTGGIAHDFNNLLQGITGGLDMIASRLNQGRIEDIPRWLSGARNSAERAAALTHRLLAFSRRQPLDPRPIDTNPLVGSLEDMLRRTLGETIALQLALADDLWSTKCDPNQLESAILNLAINARDAMPDGGTLTIETANAMIDSAYAAREGSARPGHYVCIAVTDTGTGMDRATIARAFEPFFTTKPIGQGTGLGLSMIYGFARQSEGHARITSEPGQGTTVKLYLPRHAGENGGDDASAEQMPPEETEAGEIVLVVEDEFLVRSLVVDVLEELGYAVIEAGDGNEGLSVLQTDQRIDLMITDIGLPGLNGRQVADAGRALRPGLKVLFMTGYAENAAIASGFLEPGMAMITKPFAMDVLTRRVRDIIEG